MRQILKRFTRLTAGYSVVSLVGPVATIFLTPLYTRVLTPADYGVVDIALTLSSIISVFVILGMDQALSTLYFDGDDPYRRDLVTTATVYVGVAGTLIGIGLFLMATPIAVALFHDPARSTIVQLLATNMVSVPIYSLMISTLRLRMSIKRVNVLGLGYLGVLIISNVTMTLVFGFRATGVVAANVLANAFACLLGVVLVFKPFRGRFSAAYLRKLAPIGATLLPGALSGLLFQSADRIILTQYVPQSDIGLYSIANKLASILTVAIGPAWNAWWPMALEMSHQPDSPRHFARMEGYFIAGSTWLALALGLFAEEILKVFTRAAYLPATPYTLVLLIYYGPLSVMTLLGYIGLFARKQPLGASVASVLGAAVNIALNVLLAPAIGIWGAVAATVISATVVMVTVRILSQRAMPIPHRWAPIVILVALFCAMIGMYLFVPALDALAWKIFFLALFAAVIVAVGIVTPRQIASVLHSARNRWIYWKRGEG